MRRLSSYIMDANLAVLTNADQESAQGFIQALYDQRAEIEGESPEEQHLDRAGLEALKAQLASNTSTIKVK